MALGLTELVDEVKACIGRDDDTTLITDARVMRWLNKAQEDIAEKCAGLIALDFRNTTSVDFTHARSWALADWTSSITTPLGGADVTTSNRVCHIKSAYYCFSSSSHKLQFIPLSEFDDQYIDMTNVDFTSKEPRYFTRRGNNLEIAPGCSTTEVDKDFRLDGSLYPPDFTATDSTALSALERADDLLIAYAVFKAWAYIGKKDDAQAWLAKYNGLLDEYKERNDILHEWDANIYGEFV
jgi:hypothetical protein